MKTLVITTSYGDNAPGKVYSALVEKLRNDYNFDIDVITTAISEISTEPVLLFKRKYIHHRIRKVAVGLFAKDVFDCILSRKIVKKIDINKYDFVFSMISLHNFLPLYLGNEIQKLRPEIEWSVYSVDAIPPPVCWGTYGYYRNGLIKMMNKFLRKVDHLYFSNEVMLEYQLNLLEHEFKGRKGYIYTLPQILQFTRYQKEEEHSFNFLYTGGIYEARKPDELIKAFYDFANIQTASKLYFVGTNPMAINLEKYDETFKSKIIFVRYTNDLKFYYKLADVLIDIDAAFENDVFVSSKFFNYLMVDRPILCITSNNSPTSLIVEKYKIPEVYVVNHISDIILQTMLKIFENQNDVERSGILNDEFRKVF
jgi:hypothetical protein